MSDDHWEQDEPRPETTASLRLARGPLVAPVLCRVVSMVLARANCPMDRLDDALLLCDALSAHAPEQAGDGSVAFALSTHERCLELRVAELPREAGARLVRDSVVPGVGNVLQRVADELRIEPAVDGEHEELVLELRF
ncbi:MAG TPA: hypothetical protein VMU32_12230 [Solirubrobacteraceae bacterium]|nr:hypothetical protein [Solirubrobacteraceae bacterium]